MPANIFVKYALTGGAANAVDGIDAASLTTGDPLFAYVSSIRYDYLYNATVGGAESSPTKIAPDKSGGVAYAGDGRWILQGMYITALTVGGDVDISGALTATSVIVDGKDIIETINPLAKSQGVHMIASTTVGGISAADATDIENGTNAFSVFFRGSLPTWNPTTAVVLVAKYAGGLSVGWSLQMYVNGQYYMQLVGSGGIINGSLFTPASTLSANSIHEIMAVVIRETASVNGSISLYIDGELYQTKTISAGSGGDISNSEPFRILGLVSTQYEGLVECSGIYNHALTAAEVLNHYKNGPAFADIEGSQTAVYESDFSAGLDGWVGGDANVTLTGNVDSIDGEDDWLSVERINSAGRSDASLAAAVTKEKNYNIELKIHNPAGSSLAYFIVGNGGLLGTYPVISVPAGSTVTTTVFCPPENLNTSLYVSPADVAGAYSTSVAAGQVFYFKTLKLFKAGITGRWDARDATQDKIYDSSGNNNDAAFPASGATLMLPDRVSEVQATTSDGSTNGYRLLDSGGNEVFAVDSDGGVTAATVSAASGDLQGGYITSLQNTADLVARGPGYHLNGVDNTVAVPHNTALNVGTGDFSVLSFVSMSSIEAESGAFVATLSKEGAVSTGFALGVSSVAAAGIRVRLAGTNYDGAGFVGDLSDGKNHVLGASFDRDGNVDLFIDGDNYASADISAQSAVTLDTATDLYIGRRAYTAAGHMSGSDFKNLMFNLKLSVTEMKALSAGAPIPYKYLGASQTELTSGTLTIGKRYRLKDWITADDFTNVGAASNADGVEFTATGTTPTTWTNSSVVVQIGCVLDLSPDGIGTSQWRDASGNALHGTVSGAIAMPNKVRDERYSPQVNQLTNAEFLVNSQSELANYGVVLEGDDCSADNTANWTLSAGGSLTFDTDHYEWAQDGAGDIAYLTAARDTEIGHLYRVSLTVKDGTASGKTFQFRYWNGAVAKVGSVITTTGSWVAHTFTFESTDAGTETFQLSSLEAFDNIEFKDFSVYEVVPSYTAADTKAPDGWFKDVTLGIYVQKDELPNAPVSTALKCVPGAAGDYLSWPKDYYLTDWFKRKFNNVDNVTFGIWAKTSESDHFRLQIDHDGTDVSSDYHTGGGDWEWITVTLSALNVSTGLVFRLSLTKSSGDVYLAGPMLVFGSVCERFVPRPGEVVVFDTVVTLNDFYGDSHSTTADTEINLREQSNGKLPAGISMVHGRWDVKDSGSSAGDAQLSLGKDISDMADILINIGNTGLAMGNNLRHSQPGIVNCNDDGNFEHSITATGAGTFVTVFYLNAVELR